MAPSTYDINVQLMLATTAEHEGDLSSALVFLANAHCLARTADHQKVVRSSNDSSLALRLLLGARALCL